MAAKKTTKKVQPQVKIIIPAMEFTLDADNVLGELHQALEYGEGDLYEEIVGRVEDVAVAQVKAMQDDDIAKLIKGAVTEAVQDAAVLHVRNEFNRKRR